MYEIEAKKRHVELKLGNQNASKTNDQKIDQLISNSEEPVCYYRDEVRTEENRNLVNQKIDEQGKNKQSLDVAAETFGTNR